MWHAFHQDSFQQYTTAKQGYNEVTETYEITSLYP